MHKIVKVTLAISITVIFTISLYFVALGMINNNTPTFSSENFSIFRYSVSTGPYAGLGVIRIEYVGSQKLQGNLTIQANYKDNGELVSGKSVRTGIEPGWRTEIPLYRPSDIQVIITMTYNGKSMEFLA